MNSEHPTTASIIRVDKQANFTTVSNEIASRNDISLAAKGIYYYLMTKPNDWVTTAGGCASQLKESASTVKRLLAELEKAGYIERKVVSKGRGNIRTVTTLYESSRLSRDQNTSVENTADENTSDVKGGGIVKTNRVITNKLKTNEENSSKELLATPDKSIENVSVSVLVEEKQPYYGNPEINEMFDYWEQVVGFRIKSKYKMNRYACSNLLKTYKKSGLMQLIVAIDAAHHDKFGPKLTDFLSLQERANDLIVWAKTKGTTNASAQF